MTARDDVIDRYRSYLGACNSRDWELPVRFLADTVMVNDRARSRAEYIDDLIATITIFPDYRWELRRIVVEGEWIAVQLHDAGTRAQPFLTAPGDGASVETDEFNLYRIVDGLICEVHGTADNARLSQRSG